MIDEDSVIVIDRQQSEHKRRGALAVIMAVAFLALLGIGSTFAYLSWIGNQVPNRASMGGLTADMLEPAYTNAAVTDNGGTAVADSLMKGSTSAVNTSSYWYQNFKTALDKASTGTSDADGKINRNMSTKPKAATGIRENKSAQGAWFTINSAGTGVDEHTGTGVGEPTSIGKATGDAADIDHS